MMTPTFTYIWEATKLTKQVLSHVFLWQPQNHAWQSVLTKSLQLHRKESWPFRTWFSECDTLYSFVFRLSGRMFWVSEHPVAVQQDEEQPAGSHTSTWPLGSSKEENLSWLAWVQQERDIFFLWMYDRFNNREVRKLLRLTCTLRAQGKRVWVNLGYRLGEAEGTSQTKVKMEINRSVFSRLQDTGDALTVRWIWQPRRPYPAFYWPVSTFMQTSFRQYRDGRDDGGCTAFPLKAGNGAVIIAPFFIPVFSSIGSLIVQTLSGYPHPLAPAIFGPSRRWNQFPADVKQGSSTSATELRECKIGKRSVRSSDTPDINGWSSFKYCSFHLDFLTISSS